jgi:hypothetical protein
MTFRGLDRHYGDVEITILWSTGHAINGLIKEPLERVDL